MGGAELNINYSNVRYHVDVGVAHSPFLAAFQISDRN